MLDLCPQESNSNMQLYINQRLAEVEKRYNNQRKILELEEYDYCMITLGPIRSSSLERS